MGTWIVGGCVFLLIGFAALKLLKDRKNGNSCGCSCDCCNDCPSSNTKDSTQAP